MWTDEAMVYIGETKGTIWVTWTAEEEFDENCVVSSFKQSSVRIMVWRVIMRGVRGPLTVLEYSGGKGGGMNGQRYQDQVLDGVVWDFYTSMMEKKGNVLFQQDGAPSH